MNLKKNSKTKFNTLDKVLIICALSTVCFTITNFVCFFVKNSVPDSLIVAWFSALFGECGCCTIIWRIKQTRKEQNDVNIEEHDKL